MGDNSACGLLPPVPMPSGNHECQGLATQDEAAGPLHTTDVIDFGWASN